jgi:antitoxin HigA-1
MAKSRLPPVHPGEILREDLMMPLGLSINGLARDLRVPVTRMSEIVNGRRSITADTALRLARYFATTPEFWVNLQSAYDLDVATRASAGRIQTGRPSEDRGIGHPSALNRRAQPWNTDYASLTAPTEASAPAACCASHTRTNGNRSSRA